MTYVGKIRAKDINTGKVKYFDRTSPIPENYTVVSICRQSTSNTYRPQQGERTAKSALTLLVTSSLVTDGHC